MTLVSPICSRASREGAQRAVEEAELQAAGQGEARRLSGVAQRLRRRAQPELDVRVLPQQLEVDAELVRVVELDAEDHGLDRHLHRPDVDLGHHLVDLAQHGLVVADHQHVVAGELVAAGAAVVQGDAGLGGRGNAQHADLLGQQRRNQRLEFRRRDVVGAVGPRADAVHRLLDIVEVLRRADEDEVPLAAGDEPGRFQNGAQSALDVHAVQGGGDFALDALAGQDVQIALLAQQIEYLADVFVIDVNPQLAVPFAVDAAVGRPAAAVAGCGRRRRRGMNRPGLRRGQPLPQQVQRFRTSPRRPAWEPPLAHRARPAQPTSGRRKREPAGMREERFVDSGLGIWDLRLRTSDFGFRISDLRYLTPDP